MPIARVVVLVVALFVAAVPVARSATVASAVMEGNGASIGYRCWVTYVGAATAKATISLVDVDGFPEKSIDIQLTPRTSASLEVVTPSPLRCEVDVSGSARNVRGSLRAYDTATQQILGWLPLQ